MLIDKQWLPVHPGYLYRLGPDCGMLCSLNNDNNDDNNILNKNQHTP